MSLRRNSDYFGINSTTGVIYVIIRILILFISIFFIVSCSEYPKYSENFNFFLSEKTMIVNKEQDNTIEGEYIRVLNGGNTSKITINFPENIELSQNNIHKWIIGWGKNKPLYDSGVENLRKIISINKLSGNLILGKLLRGSGYPENGQRVVLWNTCPSGFIKKEKEPLINTKLYPSFTGQSVGFSSIIFDSISGKWIMYINEADTDSIQIYAAISVNLVDWLPANEGKPILTPKNFEGISWAGRSEDQKTSQTAIFSDVIRFNKKWYYFMDGYDKNGKRHIGLGTADDPIRGPFTIYPNPVISPANKGKWNDLICFYAKIVRYNDNFLMFYDGKNNKGLERIGLAFSKNLTEWKEYEKNPVLNHHFGWRSAIFTTEPNYIEVRNDSIFLMVTGAKKFKMGPWHHYITKRMYKDVSGNVDDAQLGVFLSTDGGKTFIPHSNNPVFCNNYSDLYENEHLGGNFELIKTDTADYIFYQAKSSYKGMKYNIMCRTRKKEK